MDATRSRQRLNSFLAPLIENVRGSTTSRLVLPVAPVSAIIVATLVALIFIVMPIDVLEGLSVDSGVAAMITAAEPPLGITARFTIAFVAALGVGGIVWFGTFLLVGARTVILNGGRDDGVPVLRRADAHPDAPARRPVFANRDLGTPFLDVKAEPEASFMPIAEAIAYVPPAVEERDIPKDLNTPLATYLSPLDPPLPEPDPLPIVHAPEPIAPPSIMAETPVPEPAAVEPMLEPAPEPAAAEPRFAPHERIETFELNPLAPATIHDLLERLERGVQRRAETAPEPVAAAVDEPAEQSLEDTLSALRELARRVG